MHSKTQGERLAVVKRKDFFFCNRRHKGKDGCNCRQCCKFGGRKEFERIPQAIGSSECVSLSLHSFPRDLIFILNLCSVT